MDIFAQLFVFKFTLCIVCGTGVVHLTGYLVEDQPEDMDMDMEGMYDDSDEGQKLLDWFSSSLYWQSFHSYIIITHLMKHLLMRLNKVYVLLKCNE